MNYSAGSPCPADVLHLKNGQAQGPAPTISFHCSVRYPCLAFCLNQDYRISRILKPLHQKSIISHFFCAVSHGDKIPHYSENC